MPKIRFTYGGFYDVPRTIFCQVNGKEILLQSGFDDVLDDYEPEYRVYLLPAKREPGSTFSWDAFPLSEAVCLGTIPVASIEFDSSKRAELESEPLLDMLGELPSLVLRPGPQPNASTD